MINLFKAYRVSSKGKTIRYIKTKSYQYDDKYNMTDEKNMTSSLNKFEILCKDNKWN